jgi:hypothetical protein
MTYRRPLLAGLVARASAAVKWDRQVCFASVAYVNDTLHDIDKGRGGRLGDAEGGKQPACGAAMLGNDDVAGEGALPGAHTF